MTALPQFEQESAAGQPPTDSGEVGTSADLEHAVADLRRLVRDGRSGPGVGAAVDLHSSKYEIGEDYVLHRERDHSVGVALLFARSVVCCSPGWLLHFAFGSSIIESLKGGKRAEGTGPTSTWLFRLLPAPEGWRQKPPEPRSASPSGPSRCGGFRNHSAPSPDSSATIVGWQWEVNAAGPGLLGPSSRKPPSDSGVRGTGERGKRPARLLNTSLAFALWGHLDSAHADLQRYAEAKATVGRHVNQREPGREQAVIAHLAESSASGPTPCAPNFRG